MSTLFVFAWIFTFATQTVFAVLSYTVDPEKQGSLRDHHVAGNAITWMDGANWVVSADINGTHMSVPGSVPGDLLSDLQNAGSIGDPLYELNFLNGSIWHDFVWTYETQFSFDTSSASEVLLVF